MKYSFLLVPGAAAQAVGLLGDFNGLSFGSSNFSSTFGAHSGLIKVSGNNYTVIDATGPQYRQIVSAGSQYVLVDSSGTPSILGSDLGSAPHGVQTVLVDDEIVYFGGGFTFNGQQGVASWNLSSSSWQPLAFGGFNGAVDSIVKVQDTVVFTGNFTAVNNSTGNATTNGTLGTLPEYEQIASFSGAKFSGDGTVDPCKGSWQVSGAAQSGSFHVDLAISITPSKVRIYNNGIKEFRILTSPANGIMNLTYIDPVSGEQRFCDAVCPLQQSVSTTSKVMYGETQLGFGPNYQEFAFVNDLRVQGLTLEALDSYSSVGLAGFEIFQTEFTNWANNQFNTVCSGNSSNANTVGQWNAQGSYLTTQYNGQGEIPSVEFFPNITLPGEYDLRLFTPGCLQDGSCASRGIVNVTVWDGPILRSSNIIYQTNNEEKFDPLYTGQLNGQPRIHLQYFQSVTGNFPVTVVAERLVIDILSVQGGSSLNGVYQNVGEQYQNYAINNIPRGSSIAAASLNNSLWLAGSFGLAQLQGNASTKLNASTAATKLFPHNNDLYLLGGDSVVVYNGSFTSLGKFDQPVDNVANLTYQGSDLLFFDNQKIFNVSSQQYIQNSTLFNASVFASGGDLFQGSLLRADDSINGTVALLNENTASSDTFTQALYVNSSYIIKAQGNIVSLPDRNITTNSTINSMLFSNNTLFMAGDRLQVYNGSLQSFPVNVSAMVYFSGSDSLLVGGQGIQLLQNKSNLTTLNGLEGSVSGMQLTGNGTVLISGELQVNNNSVSLASYDTKKKVFTPLFTGSPVDKFAQINGTNYVLSNSQISTLQGSALTPISSDFESETEFADITAVDGMLVAAGNLIHKQFGAQSAMLYTGAWEPFVIATKNFEPALVKSIYVNSDESSKFITQSVLSQPKSQPQPEPKPKPTPHHEQHGKKKIDRGFIVLIGLALAVATMTVIGLLGSIVAFVTRRSQGYHSLNPRINEEEMIDTVPPEKLMKFI